MRSAGSWRPKNCQSIGSLVNEDSGSASRKREKKRHELTLGNGPPKETLSSVSDIH